MTNPGNDAAAKDPNEREPSGLEFTFTDGSIETVETKGDHVPSCTVNMLVKIKEDKVITDTDIMLHFALRIQSVKTTDGIVWCSSKSKSNENVPDMALIHNITSLPPTLIVH
jgi:hypothetical protein